MLLEVLYRIKAAPIEHLGCRSLVRLEAFHTGYGLFPFKKAKDFSFEAFRDWVLVLYRPTFGTASMSAIRIVRRLASSDDYAFDLFFDALDSALAANPDVLVKPLDRGFLTSEPPLPVSSFLDILTKRPMMFLPNSSASCLRAFLDGYCLAAMEEDHFECLDLDGFEHWVREKLDLTGMFRWEDAVLSCLRGSEADAFYWALTELKNFRASKGPLPDRVYEVHLVTDAVDPGTQ